MSRIPWFERKFSFDFPHELYPEIMARLRGTPARLEEQVGMIAPAILKLSYEERWSVQENAGHLGDLEPLWYGRIEDISSGLEVMREADLSNTATYQAKHNDSNIADLLQRFRELRGKLIAKLGTLQDEDFAKSSLHPRLDKPMRLVDLCLFVAEHDDFHLATIKELSIIFEKMS
ncbi:MAG: DinB family protein [candidate division Zixibacteria bacterium]|nr:DinB family protein [candidate division Zixibacteria bacterium]